MERRYTVRQASEITGVKPYVLRYWEDELGLTIRRNEMGHRYYTENDIYLLGDIRELKKKGLQLRAIREAIPKLEKKIADKQNFEKEIQSLDAVEDKTEKINIDIVEKKNTEKIIEFHQIIERLIEQEMRLKNEDEERCRSLDAAIRRQQLARKEAAITVDKRSKNR